MMHEIKFRAFDHVNKKMVFAELYELMQGGEDWTAWDYPINSPHNTGTPFEIMQFTGLLDTKGVEIYEGDIVAITNDPVYMAWSVEFHEGGFQVFNQLNSMRRLKWSYSLHVDIDGAPEPVAVFSLGEDVVCEVIGNIYENADLLEAGNET